MTVSVDPPRPYNQVLFQPPQPGDPVAVSNPDPFPMGYSPGTMPGNDPLIPPGFDFHLVWNALPPPVQDLLGKLFNQLENGLGHSFWPPTNPWPPATPEPPLTWWPDDPTKHGLFSPADPGPISTGLFPTHSGGGV